MDELEKLREENKRLRKILSDNGILVFEEQKLTRNQMSCIFLNYFHGNDSVYANRFYQRSKNTYGWSPACKNSFKTICPHSNKVKIPCMECNYFSRIALNQEILLNHFYGTNNNMGIGIYPLQADNTCYFAAIDFDEDDWFESLLCVYRIAKSNGFNSVMERSSSGNGGHIWLFFRTAIPASLARKFAVQLLKEGMNRNKSITFSSFDRIFPSQDYVTENGLGNLIALPYRNEAWKRNNSVFIDENGVSISSPIVYLNTIRKITEEEINAYVIEDDYFFESIQGSLNLGNNTKYTEKIEMTEGAMIQVLKSSINAATLNVLRRTASLMNPEYIDKVNQRKPIYKISRVISLYEEDDRYIYIPRGCLEMAKEKMPDTKWNIKEKLSKGLPIDITFIGTPKAEQKEAVEILMRKDMGILHAHAGWGKTICGIYLISKVKVSTLIIVNTEAIQNQWIEKIKTFCDYEGKGKKKDLFVGRLDGKHKNKLTGNIDVAIGKSLANTENIAEITSNYGMIIIDECHHVASNTISMILKNSPVKRIYAFTATPNRDDGLTKIIYMFCGPVRKRYLKEYSSSFKKVIIPRYTNARILNKISSSTEMNDILYKDKARNYLIFRDIHQEYRNGSKIIVLSERIAHLELLKEMLDNVIDNVYILHSKMKSKEQRKVLDEVRTLNDEPFVLLATSSEKIGEGFDLPVLDTMFLLLHISSENRVEQYTGRIEREYKDKEIVKVYDYVDMQINMAKAMFHKRLKKYQKQGYVIEENNQEITVDNILYSYKQFNQKVKEDIEHARKEIIIFSYGANIEQFQSYYVLLQKQYERGVKLYFVVNKDIEEDVLNYMEGLGGNVIYTTHNKHLVLIDKELVWNCSDDLFDSSSNESYYTRHIDSKLCEEIIMSIKEYKQERLDGLFSIKS